MNIVKKLLAVAILVAVSTSAFAAEKQNEISIFGSITSSSPDTGPSATTTTVNISFGHYITDQFVLTVSDFIMLTSTPTSDDGFNLIGLGAKYYLSDGKKGDFVPFGEGGLNFGVLSFGTSTATIGGFFIGGGASYYMSETASADLHLNFGSQTVTPDIGPSFSQSQTQFLVGLTQRF